MLKIPKRASIISRTMAAIALGLLITYTTYPGVHRATAEASCSTIQECTNQINANKDAVSNLKNEAVSYRDAVTRLQSQINIVQAQINDSKQQQAQLEREIADAQAQLETQKSLLANDIRTMYVDGQMTPMEALAVSNSLSDYVDKEEYRTRVMSAIQEKLEKIGKLQNELQTKKAKVAQLLNEQQSQANQLAADRATQVDMLSMNQSQQASYNAQTAANQAKLNALIAAQRKANESPSAGGYAFIRFPGTVRDFNPSSYPYANSGFSMSTAPGCNDNDGPDKWGYCTRQCVSYAAWAVEASGRTAPKGWGSAKYWDDRARAAGIPVYGSPQPGDIAVSNSGTWGHVMYVEAVSGDRMYVSQYNQQLTGQFSYQWRDWQ